MSLTNIKSNLRSERGFTIVELLIVVVVIAILAAITIVSYNGITSRANASAAKTALGTAQKKIELFYGEKGRYPISTAELTGDSTQSYFIPAASFTGNTNPDSDTGKKAVRIELCRSSTTVTDATTVEGTRITWYEFDKTGGAGTTQVSLGVCNAAANRIVNMP